MNLVFRVCVLFILTQTLRASTDSITELKAQWFSDAEKGSYLIIDFEKAITEKQKQLIESGFSSYSSIQLWQNRDEQSKNLDLWVRLDCTVQYDTWEESYDISRFYIKNIAPSPESKPQLWSGQVKTLGEYIKSCMQVKVDDDSQRWQQLKRLGGVLFALLKVDQISREKSQKVKDWLIKQQSGLMQGIFAHTLGDLDSDVRVKVRVIVPPLSQTTKIKYSFDLFWSGIN